MVSDEDLVRQIQDGEILVFEVLVKKYQNRLTNFANRIVFDKETAKDVVQEAFIKTYFGINKIDTRRKFSTFLFAVAKNLAIDHLRRKKHEVPLKDNFSVEMNLADEAGVRSKVAELPAKFRQPVELYYFGDLSYEEIAKKLRLPINTVRTNLRRGKEKLKWMLQEK